MIYAETFLAMLTLDIIWAIYTKAMARVQPHSAATASMGIVCVTVVLTNFYTENIWTAIPAMAGAYLGTFIGTIWERKSNVNKG